jgi:serine/threonine protein kinase
MLDQTVLHRIEMGVCPATSTGNRLSGHSRESSADAALPVFEQGHFERHLVLIKRDQRLLTDSAWAVRPLEIVRDRRRTMLVLEDSGGEPLSRQLGAPMEVGSFLSLAIRIAIAIALGKLHRRGLVHKDLKPAHIVANCADGQVGSLASASPHACRASGRHGPRDLPLDC